jgi:hypothetical protein
MAEIRIQSNGKKSIGKKIGGKNVAFVFNGERRSSTVADKKHHNKGKKKGKKSGRNPFLGRGKGKRGGRNPFTERGGMSGDLATGAGVITSIVVAEIVEEKFLANWNAGIGGYLLDAAICSGVGFVGGRFLGGGRNFLKGGLYGAAGKIAVRALQDMKASPANALHSAVRNQQAIQASNGNGNGNGNGNANGNNQTMGRPVKWNLPMPPTYRQLPDGTYASPTLGRPTVMPRQVRHRR